MRAPPLPAFASIATLWPCYRVPRAGCTGGHGVRRSDLGGRPDQHRLDQVHAGRFQGSTKQDGIPGMNDGSPHRRPFSCQGKQPREL
jgi:hypothetical protein